MFDFRYHALSLAAVFLALAVGLLLGVAIGDRQLISSARKQLQDNLKQELAETQATVADLREELARAKLYEEQTFPLLVRDRLADRRVAVVFLNGRDDDVFRWVRDSVIAAGGELATSYTVTAPLDYEQIAEAADGTRYELLAADPTLVEPFARRVARQMLQPGRFLRQIRPALFTSTAGELQAAEAVVVVHFEPPDDLDEQAEQRLEVFERALVGGLTVLRTPVAGVETSGQEPSQIEWYRDRGLATVDNLDQPAGRAALVYVLDGSASGSYGIKPTRDAFLPDALTAEP